MNRRRKMPRATGWLNAACRMGLLFALACVAWLPSWAAAGVTQSLDAGWQFRLAPGDPHARQHQRATRWLPATVPGTVQTDLMALKLVPDPYWRTDTSKIQWVGLSDWQYRTHFDVGAAILARRHVDLVFDGLDTFAEVYLNGHRILSTDNMFRRWRVPVKRLLHAGENTLEVRLHSPIGRLLPWLRKQPYVLPGEFAPRFGLVPKGELTATYVRKAAYQYGWDWGPRIVTEGIWQRVELQGWDALRLADFHVAQRRVGAAVADLQAQLELQADHTEQVQVRLRWRAPDGSRHSLHHTETLHAGDNPIAIPFRIEHPQRWWPAGYGKPNLYAFHVEVAVGGNVMADADRTTGLRSVELRRRKDRWGKSFEFVVNGVPVFAKGANFIPMDMFPSRVTPAHIRQLLQSARDANMNMLRVWGGGYYLPDDFYVTADRLGLMVWQEFMFGGAIPPADKAFRDNVRIEAVQQVRRLRDHPSIVLWCGNNEVEDGWEDWGDRKAFKKSLAPAQVVRIERGMRTLFDHTLRDVVAKYEPSVSYWPSSPGTDYEGPVNVTGNGDYHYWNVWSGDALPAAAYLDVTPRFMTEYGLQSMPVMATIDSFTRPSDRSIDSKVMRWHQKFDHGNARLLKYITREYGRPADFAATVYLSQVMQAEGIQLAAEHLRASRPQSMGSLFWQLDDVWPGITWSSIDGFGRWKMLQYHARRFYAPVRVVALRAHGSTRLDVVSDRTGPFDARLRIRVIDMDGKVLLDRTRDVHVAALASTRVADLPDAALLHGADPRRTFAVFDLDVDGKRLSRHFLCFDHAGDLQLPDPGLQATLAADGRSVTVSARRFAREVWVTFGKLDARLSDDAFDLLPGESVTLKVTSTASAADLRKALRVRSLYGAAVPAPRNKP